MLTAQSRMRFTRTQENLIANLRGVPEDKGRASFDEFGKPYNWRNVSEAKYSTPAKGAAKVDSLLEVIIEKHRIGQPRPEELLLQNWRAIIGEENAHVCMPVKIGRGGTVMIKVASPIIRRELMWQKRRIMERIKEIQGLEEVRELRFVAG